MARIESIRPGGDIKGRLGTYPLPQLLIGILRSNLSGSLDIRLSETRRNVIYFKDGVPVATVLPDLDVSLAQILIAFGELDATRGGHVSERARTQSMTESRVITIEGLCSEGAVLSGMRARAKAQVVKLFDANERPFRFLEGAPVPDDVEVTILQPLPLTYQGLLTARDRTLVQAFLTKNQNARFKLTDTYPLGVDPFEWGPQVESVISRLTAPLGLDDLSRLGLPRDQAAVALTTLALADMIDVLEPQDVAPLPKAKLKLRPTSAVGMRIPSRGPGELKPIAMGRPEVPSGRLSSVPAAIEAAPADPAMVRGAIMAKLSPLFDKNYYEILRVTPASSAEQIERAGRYLVRKEVGDGPAQVALRATIEEALGVLSNPEFSAAYSRLANASKTDPQARSERAKLEAAPKLDRALAAMVDRRTAEADVLLEWAAVLDPSNADLRIHRAFLGYCRASSTDRRAVAEGLRPMLAGEAVKNPSDYRLQLFFSVVLAEVGDRNQALGIVSRAPDQNHPLARLVRARLQS